MLAVIELKETHGCPQRYLTVALFVLSMASAAYFDGGRSEDDMIYQEDPTPSMLDEAGSNLDGGADTGFETDEAPVE